MPSPLIIRAPFLPVSSSKSSDYTIIDNFAASGRTTVEINGAEPARLTLQPVLLPCKLTFKPYSPQTIPADPSKAGAAAVVGDLFLELADPKSLGAVVRTYNYPSFLFAYLGINLTSSFIQETVLKGSTLSPLWSMIPSVIPPSEVSNAFALGEISVTLKPTKSDPAYAFPTVRSASSAGIGTVTLACGVRTAYDPFVDGPRSLHKLSANEVLATPEFVPFPIHHFYRMLRRLPTWNNLAANKEHADHAFFEALDKEEDGTSKGRWRRLRLFLPDKHYLPVKKFPQGKRPETPVTIKAYDSLSVRATNPMAPGAELWKMPLNRLGEVFVKRPDNEPFRLQVSDADGNVPVGYKAGGPAAHVDLQCAEPASGKEPPGLDITVHPKLAGDPLAIDPLVPLKQNAEDKLGLTIDLVERKVIADRELISPFQKKLAQFGFGVTKDGLGKFDVPTRHAVREFQREARMRERTISGTPVDPATIIPFTGAINGIADKATLKEMRAWQEKGYRSATTFHVVLPGGQREDDIGYGSKAIVRARVFANGTTRLGSIPKEAYRSSGLANLNGVALRTAIADPALTGEFPGATWEKRAICEVTHVEARVFEALNTWDNSFLSVGLFQWTLGRANESGELPGICSTLSHADFTKLFQEWGLEPTAVKGALNKSLLYGLFKLDGNVVTLDLKKEFRAFRWAYRFFIACQDLSFRKAQYMNARSRVEVVLATRLTYAGQPITAKQFLQSEFLRAVALDQHVNRPGHVQGALQACADALHEPSRLVREEVGGPAVPPIVPVYADYPNSRSWAGDYYRDHVAREKAELRAKLKKKRLKPTPAQLSAIEAKVRNEMPTIEAELDGLKWQVEHANSLSPLPNIDPTTGSLVISQRHYDSLESLYKWRRENVGDMPHPEKRWESIKNGGHAGVLGKLERTPMYFTP